jgi:subtilisin family serine protease
MSVRRAVVIVAMATLARWAQAIDTSVPFIQADQVHAQFITGLGVTVAVVDTGIDYTDPGLTFDIAPGGISIVGGVYIYDLGVDPNSPGGHGTLMSLVVTDPTGVAPDARILPIRVTGASGDAMMRDAIRDIDYVSTLRAADPSIHVINYSFGTLRNLEIRVRRPGMVLIHKQRLEESNRHALPVAGRDSQQGRSNGRRSVGEV